MFGGKWIGVACFLLMFTYLKISIYNAAFCRIFMSVKLVLILIMLTLYKWKFSHVFLHFHLNRNTQQILAFFLFGSFYQYNKWIWF